MTILSAHTRDPLGVCAGCRAWWGRLVPYPCTQVEWALIMAGHEMTQRFLTDNGSQGSAAGVTHGTPQDATDG